MTSLYPFQASAADQIASRVVAYLNNRLEITSGGKSRFIPFIQLLSSITASGKTIILADAVASIAKQLPVKPVVLWLSKATVVVEQTYASLDAGGVLHSLIEGFTVRPLADFDTEEVKESKEGALFFATVGTFNQKDKEQGTRRVFRSAIDDAARSTWESMQLRLDLDGNRRPLIVVYDEAHNLSDQQTDLLLELEPDAFLLSTATQRLPRRFYQEIVEILYRLGGWSEIDLITQVDAKGVADSGLIKTTVELVGRQAPMEVILNEMHADLAATESDGNQFGLCGLPKAVYICKTNIVEGSDERDNHKQPFAQRQAPPILIWRHLTEQLGVDPAEVAVYSNLKVDKSYPLPPEFVLFSGGDKDYDQFVKGAYRHIIFNQSLQEGWDEPLVYFAYIDKSMGSRVQAEQIVGRLLRQPGRKLYSADRLNTAQIHVRVESAGVFDEVVNSVQEKIRNENLAIKLVRSPPGAKPRVEYPPKKKITVPVAAVITDHAQSAIEALMASMHDYRNDGTNTVGTGRMARVQKLVGEAENKLFEWTDVGHSAFVLTRWLFAREVRRIYPNALGIAITSSTDGTPTKFDARVGLGSPAAVHIASVAKQVAEAFIDNAYLKLRRPNPFTIGPVLQHTENVVKFTHSLHDGYDGLNDDELAFAQALDRTKLLWCRNPSRSGYSIPLIEPGRTENFYPDFLVWTKKDVFAIDTKGGHLHADAMRKLARILPAKQDERLFVRFVSPGIIDEKGPQKESSGYTVWSFKPNGERAFTPYDSIDAALARCLKPDV